ncbi:hypothetical protein A2U01_0087419, partial [Trifolium medium]
MFSVA